MMALASLTASALSMHIVIALTSVGWATYTMIMPSRFRLAVSYGGIATTLATGVYLVVATGAPMLRSCLTGLFFVCTVCMMNFVAQRRMAGQQA